MNKAVVSKIGFFSGLALFCIIFSLDEIPGLSRSGQITLCVFLLMGIWWATEALPLPITSLMPLVLFPILGVEEIGVISKEYMNKVQFLFAGGFMIAIAMQKWNLHRRVALTILQHTRLDGKSIVAAFMGISALLSMWVMNTSTTIMLLPIAVSVCFVVCDTVKGVNDTQKI
ncbi:MAG: SLC13 family permease, partial [Burkholderiaceae bacterium]